MAEGRIIKASAFTSDSISNLSDFQFRLWVGLITHADNVGRGDARPAILKGQLFPLRDKVRDSDIKKALEALADNGSICLYEVSGKPFYAFPKWFEHQRLRPDNSKFPSPDDPAATRRNSPQLAATRREMPPRREEEEEEEVEGKRKRRGREDSVCIPRTRTREEDPDADRWGEFWEAYPRKSGGDIREACLEYGKAIDGGADPEALIAAAKALAARTSPETFRYIPSAEKWLRNKGWLERPTAGKGDTSNIFLQIHDQEYGR